MKLHSLQLLRAVAIGLVVYAHSIDLQMAFSVSRQQNFFYLRDFGAIGVDLFFVVSGFVITLVAYGYSGAEDGRKFLVKRFLRINPIYYLVSLVFLGILVAASLALHDPPDIKAALPRHKLLQSLFIFPLYASPGRVIPLLGIGWTLSFEWLFYGFFFLLILFKSRHKALVLITLVTLLVLIGRLAHFRDNRLVFITNPIVLEFLLGVIICRVYTVAKAIPTMLAVALVLGGIGMYVYEIFYGFGAMSEVPGILNGSLSMKRFLFWGLPSSLLVAGCVFLEKKNVFSPLWNNKWIGLAGDASYSIYLIHMLVFFLLSLVYKQVKYWALPDLGIILQLALAMIAGTWFYTKVERPLLRKINGPGTRAAKIK